MSSIHPPQVATKSRYRKATGVRRANSYLAVERSKADSNRYPTNSPALLSALHDVGYYQGMLANHRNFSKDSRLEVFEVVQGNFQQRMLKGEQQCRSYLEVSLNR